MQTPKGDGSNHRISNKGTNAELRHTFMQSDEEKYIHTDRHTHIHILRSLRIAGPAFHSKDLKQPEPWNGFKNIKQVKPQ